MADKQSDTDKRFDKIDRQLVEMRRDFNGQLVEMRKEFSGQMGKMRREFNAQLDSIATVVIKGFARIDKALDQKADKADIQKIFSILDGIAKRQETADIERLIMAHQINRLNAWAEKAGKRIGIRFAQ